MAQNVQAADRAALTAQSSGLGTYPLRQVHPETRGARPHRLPCCRRSEALQSQLRLSCNACIRLTFRRLLLLRLRQRLHIPLPILLVPASHLTMVPVTLPLIHQSF